MIDGETVLSGAPNPGTALSVLQSAAGFYVGYLNTSGIPYSRETNYFSSESEANSARQGIETALAAGSDPRELPYVR